MLAYPDTTHLLNRPGLWAPASAVIHHLTAQNIANQRTAQHSSVTQHVQSRVSESLHACCNWVGVRQRLPTPVGLTCIHPPASDWGSHRCCATVLQNEVTPVVVVQGSGAPSQPQHMNQRTIRYIQAEPRSCFTQTHQQLVVQLDMTVTEQPTNDTHMLLPKS